jgi:hypothetical protein
MNYVPTCNTLTQYLPKMVIIVILNQNLSGSSELHYRRDDDRVFDVTDILRLLSKIVKRMASRKRKHVRWRKKLLCQGKRIRFSQHCHRKSLR